MSYKSGTILSFGNVKEASYQEAIVITNGNVFITSLNGKPHRETMRLDDWFIINKGQDIYISLITPVTTSITTSVTTPIKSTVKNYKPRTLIRWFGKDSRRTAVILQEGSLLQVKKVDGKTSIKDNTFYTSYENWISSLPSEGKLIFYNP